MSHWPCDGFYEAISQEIYHYLEITLNGGLATREEILENVREQILGINLFNMTLDEMIEQETLKLEDDQISIK